MAGPSSSSPFLYQIPVDYAVSKGIPGIPGGDLSVSDAYGNLIFRVSHGAFRLPCSPKTPAKTLLDAFGHSLVTVVHYNDGLWQGFEGRCWDLGSLLFTVQRTSYSPLHAELQVSLACKDFMHPNCSLKLMGNPFQRSCTMYMGNSIVAQTSLNYKLGKVVLSRHKFRLTIFPGIDHTLVVALLVTFFW